MTQERLKELLDYDPEAGIFTWKRPRRGIAANSMAGGLTPNGYIRIQIDRKDHLAHRLAWLYIHGVIPEADIDHINRRKDDNRIANLRAATRSENQQNHPKRSDNTSGFPGVSWYKKVNKWGAHIKHSGRRIHIGLYETLEEAAAARAAAKAKYHTFHPEDNNEKTA